MLMIPRLHEFVPSLCSLCITCPLLGYLEKKKKRRRSKKAMEKKQSFWAKNRTSDNYGKEINIKGDHYSSTGKWGRRRSLWMIHKPGGKGGWFFSLFCPFYSGLLAVHHNEVVFWAQNMYFLQWGTLIRKFFLKNNPPYLFYFLSMQGFMQFSS